MSASAALLEGIRAIQFLEATGHPEPLLLLYHPPARTNPFQRLLYQEGWSRGIVALPLADLADAEAIAEVARGRVTVVLHLHWLNGVTERAATAAEAGALAAAFLARLDALRARECHVAWTIHNALPLAARGARPLTRRASAIATSRAASSSWSRTKRAPVIDSIAAVTSWPWARTRAARVRKASASGWTAAGSTVLPSSSSTCT